MVSMPKVRLTFYNNGLLAFRERWLFYAKVLTIDTNYKIWKKVEL